MAEDAEGDISLPEKRPNIRIRIIYIGSYDLFFAQIILYFYQLIVPLPLLTAKQWI